MKQRGFTLLEVIVTLAIFSLLALSTWQLLDQVMRSDNRLDLHATQLRSLQRALSILERDLVQARHLPLADDPSHSQAMVSQPNGLALVRGGWRNPRDSARSDLLQVNHSWLNGQWLRETKSLTSAPESEQGAGNVQTLMQDVELVGLSFIDDNGEAHPFWPSGSERLTLPTAIELQLNAPGYPDIRRLILLPGDAIEQEELDE